MRTITCINTAENIKGVFGEEEFSPFLLEDASGIYEQSAQVNITENTLTDGATYQSSVLQSRNIVLSLRDLNDHLANRQFLLSLFPPKSKGTLIFRDGDEERQTDYYVEKLTSDGIYSARSYQISLICPDPYFYDLEDYSVALAAFVPNFTFAHEFTSVKEELGYRQTNRLQDIKDEIGSDNIGITITIEASGAVKNPKVTRVESNEHIQIGTDSMPLNMVARDKIIITTADNNKKIFLERNGTRTNISQYLAEDSTFIQLHRGDNTIGYSAASGIDSMVITITYRIRYTSA